MQLYCISKLNASLYYKSLMKNFLNYENFETPILLPTDDRTSIYGSLF